MKKIKSLVLFLVLINTSFFLLAKNIQPTCLVDGKVIFNPNDSIPFPQSLILKKEWPLSFKTYYIVPINKNGEFSIELPVDELSKFNLVLNFHNKLDTNSFDQERFIISHQHPVNDKHPTFKIIHFSEWIGERSVQTLHHLIIEPNRDLHISIDLTNVKLEELLKITFNDGDMPGLEGFPKYTLTGSGAVNCNYSQLLQFNKIKANTSNYYNLPIKEALQNVDKDYYKKEAQLNQAADSLSKAFYYMQLYDLYFSNLNKKHALIRSYLYQFHDNQAEARKQARKLYGFLDQLELKEEYLVSEAFISFLGYYQEYLVRIISGKDLPDEKNINKLELAKSVFSDEILKTFLFNTLNYWFARPNSLNDLRTELQYYNRKFKDTPEAYRLNQLAEQHKSLNIGEKAPNFSIKHVETGKDKKLSQLKGKVVFITSYYKNIRQIHEITKTLNNNEYEIIYIKVTNFPTKNPQPENYSYICKYKDNYTELKPYTFKYNIGTYYIDKNGNFAGIANNNIKTDKAYISSLLSEPYNIFTKSKNFINHHPTLVNLILIIGIGLILIIITIQKVKQKQQKNQQRLLQSELTSIRSQLNPHFLFNSLNSIQNFISHSDTESANKHLSQFALLMRQVLDFSKQEWLTLTEEIEFNKNYIELEALRYGFKYEINIKENTDVHNIEIPSMLIQPFVENAIVHAMSDLNGYGRLTLEISEVLSIIKIEITDNGPGITNNNSNGFGLKSCKQRIELLNSQLKEKITIRVISPNNIVDKTGTKIVLTIPKKY